MKAFPWMTGSLASFCLMAIAGRELAGAIDTLQILFCRGLIGLLVVSLIIIQRQRYAALCTARLGLHLGRNVFHFAGQYGWFVGLGLLPLAQVFALEFTTPLWTLLIAFLFLNESLTLRKVVAIVLGSVGVIMMLNLGAASVSAASLYVVGAAVFYSLAFVATKALSATEDPLAILFYMCLIQLPVGLLLGAHSFIAPNPIQWGWLTLIGLTALTGHYCITHAMHSADASVVVTLDFLRLPLITVVGVLFYREPFNPMLLVGAGFMLIGNLINLYTPRA